MQTALVVLISCQYLKKAKPKTKQVVNWTQSMPENLLWVKQTKKAIIEKSIYYILTVSDASFILNISQMLGSFLNFLQYERWVCRKLLFQILNLEFETLIIYLNKTFSNLLGVDKKNPLL